MDSIVQLRKNIFSDWLEKALRKIEQVLSGPVNRTNRKSMSEELDVKTTKEREVQFLKALDDHRGIIHKICWSYCNTTADREDLRQEIFYRLWKAYPSFTGDSQISTWIHSVALRSAILPFRRKIRIQVEHREVLPDRPGEDPYERGMDEEFYKMFHRLGNYERATLVLIAEGYTREEIGKIMAVGKNTLIQRMARAMAVIKNYKKK